MSKAINTYSKKEEILNVISHGIGAIFTIPALVLLVLKGISMHREFALISMLVYGISLMVLYFSSALYHAVQKPSWRNPLNVWDHLSIYLLIAGSYTPFALLVIPGTLGYWICGIVWTFGIIGIIIKLFFFGKYNILSAISYVVMGWIAVIAIGEIYTNLGLEGTLLLFGGGVAYTIGAIIFLFDKRIPYNHAIFHLLVLVGSVCHFIAVYWYI